MAAFGTPVKGGKFVELTNINGDENVCVISGSKVNAARSPRRRNRSCIIASVPLWPGTSSAGPSPLEIIPDGIPCTPADLPQTLLEPILLRTATHRGFKLRFDTQLIRFTQTEDQVESLVEDLLTGQRFVVVSKFLCGADGARSSIVRDLQLPLHHGPGGGLALNVLVEADLSRLMANSEGLLHMLLCPHKPAPPFCAMAIARFIKRWDEWVFVLLAAPGVKEITATPDEILARVKELIGDDSVQVTLKRISTWQINECYASEYSRGNVFCLGDAVHRHPPHNGLGSNTCIQDAYNLAWKLAYVLQGRAGRELLDSYSAERQLVGRYIVQRANDTGRMHLSLFSLLGVLKPDVEARLRVLDEFREDSERGAARRASFQAAIEDLEQERHGLGGEMNQLYQSRAIYLDDEKESPPNSSCSSADTALYYRPSTYPGSRLPHAWLRKPKAFGPRDPPISTQDLAGHGRFTLFTGIGGKAAWSRAAGAVAGELGIEIATYAIGWGQDYEDAFFAWTRHRGVQENGAVLVRPDRTVAWRCFALEEEKCDERLRRVMRRILAVD
ncbi:hypothetical protein T310_1477 [Rasamsonia emersonii CBS 393.64]|uniref:FAD-binding domain-containing protein n=1 Tax=Rasamsonia emersonii (strain ATCC 16479 / CBS 393.64 / IMI 116815) TaxID=1408163 RepID=A0A0F4Z3I6_RASE3|nr:hypothetical protein T310_1477 [Rasamsonia emersonii CBS 393.64]KKA24448.1 hypothetical protein T310_1477 [Rasamsonia emersonii CBS 393.64]